MLVLNPEVLPPYYLWLFNLTILILYFEDFANYSLYELRMKLFFKTYRFRGYLDLLLRLMFFWRLFNHYSISIDIFIVDSNLVCFIVRVILFLFLGELVSKWRVSWSFRCAFHSCKYNQLYRICCVMLPKFYMLVRVCIWFNDSVRLHTSFWIQRNRTIIWSILYFLNVLRKIGFEYLHFENFTQSQILPDWYNYFLLMEFWICILFDVFVKFYLLATV